MAWLPRNFIQSEVSIHAPFLSLFRDRFECGWENAQHRFSTRFAANVAKQVAGFVARFTVLLVICHVSMKKTIGIPSFVLLPFIYLFIFETLDI